MTSGVRKSWRRHTAGMIAAVCLFGLSTGQSLAALTTQTEHTAYTTHTAHAAQALTTQAPVPLQPLLDRASPGDTIVLQPGTYEGPVTIDKPLTLRAATLQAATAGPAEIVADNEAVSDFRDPPEVRDVAEVTDAAGQVVLRNTSSQPAMSITAEGTTISGLHILDETIKDAPTVQVAADRVTLEGLHIRTAADGIAIRDVHEGSVQRTTITWAADGVRMADKGNGLDLFNAHAWRIEDNTISDVHDGIYMESSDDTYIAGNLITRSRYGVHCMYTSRTVITGNEGRLNVTGAMVMTAQQVSVTGNIFTRQLENVHSQGILLFDAHETLVTDNTVDGNRVGLYVEQSTGNRLESNRINGNFIGLQLLEASDNLLTSNAFTGNVVHAQARGSQSNALAGNYWDTFQGLDTDGDGRSELSYAINPFFQGVTQRRPAFQLLFQSPGIVFLEGLYQADPSSWATDPAPLMRPPGQLQQADSTRNRALTGWIGLMLLVAVSVLFYQMRRR